MITPAEIQKKEFTKGVRGYKEDEVDGFLDLITLDIDKLINENNTLKDTVRNLNSEIERYRSSEGTIFDTLESAKALMADISSSAEKRAEIMLKNAELDSDRIQREARESVERINEEAREMARRWEQFKMRYKSLLQNELERFENLSENLMSEADAHRVRFYSDTLSGSGILSGTRGDSGDAPSSIDLLDDFADDFEGGEDMAAADSEDAADGAGGDFDAGDTIHGPAGNGRKNGRKNRR
ncbi:MAG: DivIVA domain-containing protein [Clostridiales Family XIII bacterium]|jgi:cell division initiation protein|nr:DivIVA domain-containing protein [Clostridiales Family XIII bacterium]